PSASAHIPAQLASDSRGPGRHDPGLPVTESQEASRERGFQFRCSQPFLFSPLRSGGTISAIFFSRAIASSRVVGIAVTKASASRKSGIGRPARRQISCSVVRWYPGGGALSWV